MATEPITPASVAGAVDLSGLGKPRPAEGQPQPGATGPASPAGAPGAGQALATLPDAVVDGDENALDEFARLSQFMPVIVEMHAAWSHDSAELAPILAELARSAQGRLVLLRLDLDAHPSLGQQPQVLALLGGRPVQLFSGNPGREQVVQVLNELIQVAAQQGLTGHVDITGEPAEPAATAPEPELPPRHAEAQAALERGDVDAAAAAYRAALAENPADDEAHLGLARTSLLARLRGKTLPEIRERAAEHPEDLDAQLDIADLDVSGGHIEDAFARLLEAFPAQDADGRTRIRERLLELFEVVGSGDPRVARARSRLTSLLFA